MYGYIILLHVLAATIWTGGHLVLSLVLLPSIVKRKAIDELHAFEQGFEKVGMPALVIQVVTGFWLAFQLIPEMSLWFNWQNPVAFLICCKLTLLILTAAIGLHARFRLFPNLTSQTLPMLTWHIITVTLLSVLFVVIGTSFKSGLLYF
jgi:putative copper export protein